jgi:hypothetical protein
MNEWLNSMKVCAPKERSCRKYECAGTKSKFCEVSDGTLHTGLFGAWTLSFSLVPKTPFRELICCRLWVKVWGGIY